MLHPLFHSLALHRLPDVGAVTFTKLIDQFGTPENAFAQPTSRLEQLVKPVTLAAVKDFQDNLTSSIVGQKVLADLDWLAAHQDVAVIAYNDSVYPDLLRQISKPPPLLFVRGDATCLNLPQIAIVGSRNPSSGGCENAHRFANYLSSNGFAITSGLALGVDAAAHEGALAGNGKTIGVMGTGVDLIYPSRHRQLAQRILASGGALVSEFPLSTGAQAAHFPQRNRIISGLSCGVLVVEAAIQSGSLITARTALEQNREVFAIPGSIHNPLARGCHQLIRQGATLVETGKDIVEQLDGILSYQRENLEKVRPQMSKVDTTGDKDMTSLSPVEHQLITAMGFDPVTVDELVERTDIAVGSLAAQLIGLEIKGFIQQIGAGYQRM